MSLFKSVTHQEIWIEHHCGRCHFGVRVRTGQGLQCPILARALRTDRKPVEWERNPRKGALMADTIKCHKETRTPPRTERAAVPDETLSMFDVTRTVTMDSDHA